MEARQAGGAGRQDAVPRPGHLPAASRPRLSRLSSPRLLASRLSAALCRACPSPGLGLHLCHHSPCSRSEWGGGPGAGLALRRRKSTPGRQARGGSGWCHPQSLRIPVHGQPGRAGASVPRLTAPAGPSSLPLLPGTTAATPLPPAQAGGCRRRLQDIPARSGRPAGACSCCEAETPPPDSPSP